MPEKLVTISTLARLLKQQIIPFVIMKMRAYLSPLKLHQMAIENTVCHKHTNYPLFFF